MTLFQVFFLRFQGKAVLEHDRQDLNGKSCSIPVQAEPIPWFISCNDFSRFLNTIKSNWTADEWHKVEDELHGRVGCKVQTELPIPPYMTREYENAGCAFCSAKFIRWMIQFFLAGRSSETIEEADIYVDSDGSGEELSPREFKRLCKTDFNRVLRHKMRKPKATAEPVMHISLKASQISHINQLLHQGSK